MIIIFSVIIKILFSPTFSPSRRRQLLPRLDTWPATMASAGIATYPRVQDSWALLRQAQVPFTICLSTVSDTTTTAIPLRGEWPWNHRDSTTTRHRLRCPTDRHRHTHHLEVGTTATTTRSQAVVNWDRTSTTENTRSSSTITMATTPTDRRVWLDTR